MMFLPTFFSFEVFTVFFAVIRWDLQATVWLMIFNTLIFFQIVPDTKNSEKFFSKQW